MTTLEQPSSSTDGAVVVTVDPATDPRWETLARSAGGSLFVSPPWIRALRDTYGFEFTADVVVDPDGRPRSGWAWVDVDDLRGRRLVALPFCDYADPVLARPDDWPLVSERAFAAGRTLRMRMRARSASTAGADGRLVASGATRWHRVDLARNETDMWEAVHESARRAIRQSRRRNVGVRVTNSIADVQRFYEMHASVRRRKYSLLAQPFALFEHIRREFVEEDRFRLMLAEVDGTPVGGTLYLEWGDTIYYKFNASWSESLDVRPNDLLVWSGMSDGHRRGLRGFDFGQSDLDQPGLLRYKEKYATESGDITTLVHRPTGWTDDAVPALSTLHQLTAIAVGEDASDEVYRRLGDLLYGNFC